MSDLAFLLEVAAERDRLRAENERLTGRLEVYKQEVGDLGGAIDECEARIAELEGDRDTATLALSDLRAALERLGSMEAFCVSRAIGPADDELIARITFAQSALSQDLTNDK